ncbi:anaerobic carbon-monoxide dehydrogenase catalytic subunit [Helicobacter sp. 11S02629-2]|uniref:anaerobic carbon-monoxide dehydrogenase catalytic subunit n=1 Tax=Helicobacter sp. 11S02629-2 TaxID=1476195 RepID=UPI000BA6B5B7|nr:anaerobic carbon-monoxide dehydrogenase catalytic subunit [Helicobacter sp. 11S02629-2]PAF45933.1 carbon-monoxide dehydrogenase catalytic subunit [Helicobacter sp. 11S02629-2]
MDTREQISELHAEADGSPKTTSSHGHEHGVDDYDYMKAVNAYRKTFASKQDVLDQTPDPAVREMLLYLTEKGISTPFDRFDSQKPQCGYGLSGICCKNCNMGPCKITKKSPKGVCGADENIIVSRNMLRAIAGGTAAHGIHAREVILALKFAAQGKLDLPILGENVLREVAPGLGVENSEKKGLKELAIEVADALLEDLSRTSPDEYKVLKAFAPAERQKVWEEMDAIPISAYHEVFEALHRSNEATDGDWRNIMKQFTRCGLTFLFSTVVAPALATDILFGLPTRKMSRVNVGALEEGYVNIAVHGHLPVLISKVIELGRSQEFVDLAKSKGAKGIKFYGICCTGLTSMYRFGDVVPLSNSVGAELVLGTGALDCWVADIQDVFPGIMEVAKCFKTTVITTSDSARLIGAEHYAYDHHHSNVADTDKIARKIMNRAIESYVDRRDVEVRIPKYEVNALVGFTSQNVAETYGGFEPLANAIKEGKILGIVNLVGCTNPRVIYEKAVYDITKKLIANNILITTNGCASFPMLKMGLCDPSASKFAGEGLREFVEAKGLPPIWHVGECVDNTRSVEIFGGVASVFGKEMMEMPFAMSSPEWANEKGIGASYCFRLLGMDTFHCVHPPVYGAPEVMDAVLHPKALGSTMNVDTDPLALADKIIANLKSKRAKLGWVVDTKVEA